MLTDNPLAGDADLSKRVINAKGTGVAKDIWILVVGFVFSLLLVFKCFPRSVNREVFYHFIYNQGTFEVVSASVRFMATPLLFVTKFIVISIVYPGRTVIIKMPLIRHAMPKKKVRGFVRRREDDHSERMSALRVSIQAADENRPEREPRWSLLSAGTNVGTPLRRQTLF